MDERYAQKFEELLFECVSMLLLLFAMCCLESLDELR